MTGPGLESLDWDTEFFGFGVGRVLDFDPADSVAVRAMEDEARAAGITCLYASLDPIDAPGTVLAQRLGYRFVEAATLFDLPVSEPPIPRPDGIDVRVGNERDLEQISDMIESLAPWSRFAVDPRFGAEQARRLQHATTQRAATCTDGSRALVVAEDDDGIQAFITRAAQPEPRVDAVGTRARGSGASRYLIEHSRTWARPGPLLGGPIAARNVNALRYVRNCGYRVARVSYLYHRWLDEV